MRIKGFTCVSKGLRAGQWVNVRSIGCALRILASRASTCTAPDTFVPKTQTTSPTTARFQRFSPRWSVFWAPQHPKLRPQSLKTGGNDAIQSSDTPATRRQKASHGAKPPLPPQSEATPWFAGRGLTAYGSHALQTSSIWSILKRPSTASVTNVVNLSRKTSIFNEKGVGLTTFVTKHKQARPIGGHREAYGARLRCRWAVAGPGRASSQRAERSSRRGRLAGGPPPTGTHSGRGLRRPEHQRGNTRHHAAHHANGWGASRHPTRHQHQSTNRSQPALTPSPVPPRG